MKMSDAFKLPLKSDSNDSSIIGADGGLIVQFASSKNNEWHDVVCVDDSEMKLIAHAINNHDRMVEEIAALRKGLEIMIEQFESDHNCEYEYKVIKLSKKLLAKLNQEGG